MTTAHHSVVRIERSARSKIIVANEATRRTGTRKRLEPYEQGTDDANVGENRRGLAHRAVGADGESQVLGIL